MALAAMELDKQSVWDSLKEKTRPLLQNLTIKRSKRSSQKILNIRKRHHLSHRMSVSVPDMMDIGYTIHEERDYTDCTIDSTSISNSHSSPMVSHKKQREYVQHLKEHNSWMREDGVHMEIRVTETDVAETSDSETKEEQDKFDDKSILDLLHKECMAEGLSDGRQEGNEVRLSHQCSLSVGNYWVVVRW